MNKKGIAPVLGEVLMVGIVLVLVAILASYVFGLTGDVLPGVGIPPAFTVSRKNDTTIHVVLHQKMGVGVVEKLRVCHPTMVRGSLNSSVPTGEIEIGRTLVSVGVKPGDHFVVKATVDGKEMIVIDTFL